MMEPSDRVSASLRIDNPPGDDDLHPRCAWLDMAKCIWAYGGTSDPTIVRFTEVRGTIDKTGDSKTAYPGGKSWTLPPLRAVPGEVNRLNMWAKAIRTDKSEVELTNYKLFIGVDFTHPCPPGHTVQSNTVVATVLPRYYRLRLHRDDAAPPTASQDLFLGGLLDLSSVYLAYDAAASAPSAPVWRDVNVPSSFGRWTLRLCHACCGLEAELVQEQVTDREIVLLRVLKCPEWRFSGVNLFREARHGNQEAPQQELIIAVEPV